jgi:hypothetical protein
MNKEETRELAEKRGFSLWATLGGKKLQMMDRDGINLIVDPETQEFELAWVIPKSIFQISCPKCSPFTNEEHFNKMYRKFKQTIRIHKEAIEE